LDIFTQTGLKGALKVLYYTAIFSEQKYKKTQIELLKLWK